MQEDAPVLSVKLKILMCIHSYNHYPGQDDRTFLSLPKFPFFSFLLDNSTPGVTTVLASITLCDAF